MSGEGYLAAGVEAVINRCLRMDAELGEDVAGLEGGALEVHLQGIERGIRLWPRRSGVSVEAVASDAVEPLPPHHVRISGPPATLLRMIASGNPLDGALPAGVSVSGDMHFAQRVRDLLRRADFDWEEPLSAVLGDTLARELARGARGLLAWTRSTADTLLIDMGEYVREERGMTPTRGDVEDLACEVERLRDDVERLELKIGRLSRAIRSPRP